MSANLTDVVGIVLGGGAGEGLFPLTKFRAEPAVPLAGKYRIIDIALSNCINSGIRKVLVTSQFNSVSFNTHVARTYDLDHFSQGFINILAAEQTPENMSWYQGTADAVRQCIRHFEGIDASHVLILYGDQLYHMDYRKLIDFHLQSEADITVCIIPVTASEASRFGIVKVDDNNQISFFQEKPSEDQLPSLETDLRRERDFKQFPDGKGYLASMGIYVFSKRLLIELVQSTSEHDFAQHIFPLTVNQYRMMAYHFSGYWADIGTVRSFYQANLDLTSSLPQFNLYDASNPIYTRSRCLPASRINNCQVDHCVISDGCFLDGAEITHSIIGSRTRIGEGTTISHSYVIGASKYETSQEMNENGRQGIPNIGIARNASVANAIIDRNARVGSNVVIRNAGNHLNFDGDGFYVRDRIVVIPKGAIIPDGSII
ncbi:MAG: glucose-1-phosphate adenylyltransferase [Acidobacteria bacterium]|nr:glucose-1-phosphate adenylyltransferase [Acidobacteriota bacterium]MCI0722104.1 glucose-1-phosphate adenylyltransferase [Acidobacteriota bacterium]